jgi:hypothetical protein
MKQPHLFNSLPRRAVAAMASGILLVIIILILAKRFSPSPMPSALIVSLWFSSIMAMVNIETRGSYRRATMLLFALSSVVCWRFCVTGNIVLLGHFTFAIIMGMLFCFVFAKVHGSDTS